MPPRQVSWNGEYGKQEISPLKTPLDAAIVGRMNSQSACASAGKVQTETSMSFHLGRILACVALLMISATCFSGCARMKQYSLDSWAGPLPMHDLRYVQSDP